MLIYAIICTIFQLTVAMKPNIVFIIADDLGYNDLSFHGSNQIPTPNIDALAYSGLILNNYYVNPICTPSRSALMTGKYPIHTGMQHTVLFGAEPRGLPLEEKLLPQYLGELGYESHIVGKWHLGSWKKEYTPLYRGFKSHLGYWTGHQDYYDHTAMEKLEWGLDMRRNMSIAYDLHGKYSTDIFTEESVKIIQNHNPFNPLFLYLSHAAVHSGNPYEPLRAPDNVISKFMHIEDYQRAKYAGILTKLDDSVGAVVEALKNKGILHNSIIIFTSDNGGAAAGFNLNAASNYPLRGVKNTLWEGGIKGAGLVWSPLINKPQRVAHQLMHIVDWLPTLLGAVGANVNRTDLDGINVWDSLSQNSSSPRQEILHNIDDIYGNAALMSNDWKLVHGTSYEGQWDSWYGPAGRNSTFDFGLIEKSHAGVALNNLPNVNKMQELRIEATLNCAETTQKECLPLQEDCLFNVRDDPCERNNVANEYPDVLARLQGKLQEYNLTALPPGNLPLDERGDPKYWNYVFTNFGDFDVPQVIST